MKIILSLILAGSLVACGSASDCSAKSKCSADTPATQAQIDACEADSKMAKCKAERDALGNCAVKQQTCGADNKTDGAATGIKIIANCKTESDAYTKCNI